MPNINTFNIIEYLEKNFTDFTICNRDWWRPNIVGIANLNVIIRYEVTVCHFFAVGKGLGRNLEEAVERAEKQLTIRKNKIQYASIKDLESI